MHEAFFTKNDALGWPRLQRDLINVSCNCVVLHPTPCHRPDAQREFNKALIYKYLIGIHGEEIVTWAATLPISESTRRQFDLLLKENEDDG